MTAPATKLFFSVKAFSSCNHMKGRSGSGTHDVGLIPAMYNSPTAGAQHVHLHSQDWRQASLSNWHPSWSCATQLNRGWLKGWWVCFRAYVCLVRWEMYVQMYTVVVSVVWVGGCQWQIPFWIRLQVGKGTPDMLISIDFWLMYNTE